MNAQLHPAWFEHEPGTTPSRVCIIDALDNFASKLDALGDFFVTASAADAIDNFNLAQS